MLDRRKAFLRTTVVDTHWCGGIFCLLCVFFAYYGEYALLLWVIMLDVVRYYA